MLNDRFAGRIRLDECAGGCRTSQGMTLKLERCAQNEIGEQDGEDISNGHFRDLLPTKPGLTFQHPVWGFEI